MALRVAVVGAGRMGQGIALALSRSGGAVTLLGRTARPVAPPLTVQAGGWGPAAAGAGIVLLAVPDAAIPLVAARLLEEGGVKAGQAVLHLSGLLDHRALDVLAPTGAALGSFHPLQTVADPATAPERLRGAYAGVEGDERAVAAGEALASALGMVPVRIPSGAKAAYHAGATLVANYTVALTALATRLAADAGVPRGEAARIYLPLLRGAADNLQRLAPAEALTGAIRRGDAGTVAAHLAALDGNDRVLYALLGREALVLARQAGLESGAAAAIERLLDGVLSVRRP